MKPLQKYKTAFALAGALAFATAAGANGPEAMERPQVNDNMSGKTAGLTNTFAAQVHPAQSIVAEASENMLAALKADKAILKKNPDHVYTLLEKHLMPHFDFDVTTRLVMGRHWRTATDDQRSRYTEALRNVAVNTYARAVATFDDEQVTVLPHRSLSNSGKRVQVRTRIEMDNGNDLAVDYSMYRNKNNEWKVYDLVVEGISFGITYRSQFRYAVDRYGLEGAIQDMEKISGEMRYQKPPERDASLQQKPSSPSMP